MSARRLLVLGAGGHGRVVADLARRDGAWDELAFLDDRSEVAPEGLRVLGSCESWALHANDATDFVIGIGDNDMRCRWAGRLFESGQGLVSVIAKSADLSPYASLGSGCVIMPQAVVNVGAKLGWCCIVNTGATIDHDCELGDGVHVSPGANLGGGVRVGERSWIGIGASVRHGLRIGREVVVGAGAAVVSELADGVLAVGVPARVRGN